jgi:hypothetical protein
VVCFAWRGGPPGGLRAPGGPQAARPRVGPGLRGRPGGPRAGRTRAAPGWVGARLSRGADA